MMAEEETGPSGSRLRHNILLVDDHPIVRQGLAQLVREEPDLWPCGEAETPGEARRLMEKVFPDLVVVDISLGETSGLSLIADISARYPEIPILVLSMHDEALYAERCLRLGAKGYIMKKEPPRQVIKAIRKVLSGDIYVSDNLGKSMIKKLASRKQKQPGGSPVRHLSNRELEIFNMIGNGLTTRQIAEALNLSPKTVEAHFDRIKKKLGFKDSREVVVRAAQWLARDM